MFPSWLQNIGMRFGITGNENVRLQTFAPRAQPENGSRPSLAATESTSFAPAPDRFQKDTVENTGIDRCLRSAIPDAIHAVGIFSDAHAASRLSRRLAASFPPPPALPGRTRLARGRNFAGREACPCRSFALGRRLTQGCSCEGGGGGGTVVGSRSGRFPWLSKG